MRKPVYGVSDQDHHKAVCAVEQNFGFNKKSHCTVCIAKTKALISCAVTAQLFCIFVFPIGKNLFVFFSIWAHMINAQ